MGNLIYSVNEIFTQCLLANQLEKGYYIAPYQRGYKWKSKAIYDQIPVLIFDLYEAFINNLKLKTVSEMLFFPLCILPSTSDIRQANVLPQSRIEAFDTFRPVSFKLLLFF